MLPYLGRGGNRFGNDLLIHSIAYDKAYYSSLSPNEAATLYKTGVGAVQDYLKKWICRTKSSRRCSNAIGDGYASSN